jgi:hypothetical protein
MSLRYIPIDGLLPSQQPRDACLESPGAVRLLAAKKIAGHCLHRPAGIHHQYPVGNFKGTAQLVGEGRMAWRQAIDAIRIAARQAAVKPKMRSPSTAGDVEMRLSYSGALLGGNDPIRQRTSAERTALVALPL